MTSTGTRCCHTIHDNGVLVPEADILVSFKRCHGGAQKISQSNKVKDVLSL